MYQINKREHSLTIMPMQLHHFDYKIPHGLIAQHPLKNRDQARLMVIDRQKGTITHDVFARLHKYLPSKSCLVLNDTKVIPARLLGRRETGANVEIFLLKRLADGFTYETLMRPLRRLKVGERIAFNGGSVVAEIKDKDKRLVRFQRKNLNPLLKQIGHMPLPPYIKREDTASDARDYQTVYARQEGSVAAPTAGLHFTRRQLHHLKREGHTLAHVTLHVNYATFKPVEAKDITKHQMHTEEYGVTKKSFYGIKQAKEKGRKIVAIGTTSCRVLETVANRPVGAYCNTPLQGETNLFIYPGYTFRMTDVLVTNFHLPRSTLLMMVYAFGGQELMKRAYAQAIKKKYRFYSYGDAMVIL